MLKCIKLYLLSIFEHKQCNLKNFGYIIKCSESVLQERYPHSYFCSSVDSNDVTRSSREATSGSQQVNVAGSIPTTTMWKKYILINSHSDIFHLTFNINMPNMSLYWDIIYNGIILIDPCHIYTGWLFLNI